MLEDNNQEIHINNKIQPNSVGVFYINLDKSVDRRERLDKLLKQTNFPAHRVPGVDGAKLDPEAFDKSLWKRPFSKGEIGCSISHLKAMREFLKSEYEFAVILEDDATFDPKAFESIIQKAIPHQDKWGYLYLQHNPRLTSHKVILNNSNISITIPIQNVTLATGYIVNRKTAKNIIKKSGKISLVFDLFNNRSWEMNYKFRLIIPGVIHTTHVVSDVDQIGGRVDATDDPSIKYHMYRFQTSIIRKLTRYAEYYGLIKYDG